MIDRNLWEFIVRLDSDTTDAVRVRSNYVRAHVHNEQLTVNTFGHINNSRIVLFIIVSGNSTVGKLEDAIIGAVSTFT